MLMFVFFSFSIFASLEPISDSAHTLGVIDDAMDQLDALRGEHFIDADGHDVKLGRYDIRFDHVDFGYDERKILKDVSFTIPEKTSTAIVGPSGSGKTTIWQPARALLRPAERQHFCRRTRPARIYLRQSALEHLDGLPERLPLQRHDPREHPPSASPTRRRTR